MTLPVWPTTLPQQCVRGSWRVPEVHAPNSSTEMNAGTTRSRRRYTLAVSRVQFDLVMNSAQLATFWGFYFNTIGSGAARFTMPVWNGAAYVNKTCRIKSATGPQLAEFAHLQSNISLELLVESLFQ
jgi:hypothetical protein